ncbi:MAG TPA: hypothetical protein DDY86_03985 [Syntrophaceae bacterium]|nr:hypothetical protein [Syntrophaceae bacterium]
MTTNEQIAKVMNFIRYDGAYWHTVNDRMTFICRVEDFAPDKYLPHAKLLQQRMVKDRWNIVMMVHQGGFMMSAWKDNVVRYQTEPEMKEEPAAIVALFVKVYGIEVEHE